jgi:hypothetical protein
MKIVWSRSIGWNIDNKDMEITSRIYDGCDCYPWRQVFALWPVQTVSGKYVWLRKIYKRKFWVVWGAGFHMEPHVEYGTLFDIIKYDIQR